MLILKVVFLVGLKRGILRNGEAEGEPFRARKGTRKPNLRKDYDQQDLGPGLGPAQAPFELVGVRARRL